MYSWDEMEMLGRNCQVGKGLLSMIYRVEELLLDDDEYIRCARSKKEILFLNE